jgi:heterodisulfide reductase subunit B
MCYQRLAVAVHEMGRNPQLCARVAQALGESPDIGLHRVRPLSLLNWLEQIDQEQMRSLVSSPLNGLKVACYYGCLLVRPPKITGVKEVESPRGMEKTVRVLGAQPVRWSMAMECCGASFAISRKGVVLRQGKRVYDAARKAGADVICLACPMCHSNLDLRQRQFNGDSDPPIPVLYLTQLLGLAFGLSGDELALKGHFVPVQDTLRRCLTTPSPGTPGEGRGEGHLQNQTLTPTLSQGTGRGGKT